MTPEFLLLMVCRAPGIGVIYTLSVELGARLAAERP
jgi:hypothetical protein